MKIKPHNLTVRAIVAGYRDECGVVGYGGQARQILCQRRQKICADCY
ncbi:MAG: hypothetical protein OXT68_07035 [Chloroflexota bacterium]|nr:hypothetical protein [Chloroflexota bacterium]